MVNDFYLDAATSENHRLPVITQPSYLHRSPWTALLLFMVLGRQWLLLPGLALEAIPGLGVLPFWLLVVGAIAVLGTPRPNFERH
jgi:hypothetical protein